MEHLGRTALVAGGSRGIGRAIALGFAVAGADVVIAARGRAAAEAVADEVRALGRRAVAVSADVSAPAGAQSIVDEALRLGGRLDFACNCAGMRPPMATLDQQRVEDFDAVMRVNVRGVFLCMQRQIAAMLETGGGSIVNVSSVTGLVGVPEVSPYVASKHAVNGLTKSAALEFGRRGIRINAVAPGMTRTELLEQFSAEVGRRRGIADPATFFAQNHPIGRIGEPEEIASAVLWLCSKGAGFTIGQILAVDGGQTAD
jgi:NAD(P)-dependent dehydrogenase (short-subunit alcohol dehydrogenase family)